MHSSIKSLGSIILLSTFLLITFSKVLIYANYLINKEYIAKVLCINKEEPQMQCNGKCHLVKQLKQEEKKEQRPVNPQKEKIEFHLFSESQPQANKSFDQPVTNEPHTKYMCSFSDKHSLSVFHPPSI